jgi:hypothetical protein
MTANLIKKHQFYFFSTVLLLIILFISGCKSDSRIDINLKKIPVDFHVQRFEQDLFSLSPDNLPQGIHALKEKYPAFFGFFTSDIMQWDTADTEANIRILLTDEVIGELMDSVNRVFGDFSVQEKILKEAFQRFSYHFPNIPVPQLLTSITEFSFPTATDDSLLMVSLEMFLGENYPYYPSFGLPAYKIRRMNKEHLPLFALTAWYDQIFGDYPPAAGGRFLDAIIEEGKQMYFLEIMLPHIADTLSTGWRAEELSWLKSNEPQMWTYYIDRKYLYSTDKIEYAPLINDAPFSSAPGIPPESAPRIGVYSGWQIVRKYMRLHPELSLMELILDTNADEILKGSGYRP